jgi:hypothetical protein
MLGACKQGERNRSILLAYINGRSVEQLAKWHALATVTIRGIISIERHRVDVSPEPEYCALRDSIEPSLWMAAFRRPLEND